MIQILTYNEIDKQQWRALIECSPHATWFQTPEAYDLYNSVPGMKAFAYGVRRDDDLQIVAVGYITQEKNPIKQFFTSRAIIVGGPVIDKNAYPTCITALFQELNQELKEAIYVETRNFSDYSTWRENIEYGTRFRYQPHYDIHVHCNDTHNISRRRQRELKQAITNGAIVCEAQSEQEVREWYQILHCLYREKVRTPLFSEEFFLQFYRNGVGKYLLVKHDNKVIGGMMCPVLDGKAIYEWYVCGLDEEYRDLSPSVVATHAAIEYAKANGLPLFDFMGAGVPDQPYGVRDFKMEFGGELVEHGRFLCIRKPLLYKLGKWGVKWLQNSENN